MGVVHGRMEDGNANVSSLKRRRETKGREKKRIAKITRDSSLPTS